MQTIFPFVLLEEIVAKQRYDFFCASVQNSLHAEHGRGENL